MKRIVSAMFVLVAAACDASITTTPRSLEGPAEIVAEVESVEVVGKMLGCFNPNDAEPATIIEYRDGPVIDAVMIQELDIRFSTHAHVSVGACLRDALLDVGGQVPP